MSYNQHLHVPDDLSIQSPRRRPRPTSPCHPDEGLEQQFDFETASQPISLRDIDIGNGVRRSPSPTARPLPPPSTMSAEERIAQLTELAEKQQRRMDEANEFANRQNAQLAESQRQLAQAQQTVLNLTNAFQAMSTQPQPLTMTQAPKKKPELPPFDSKNVLIWIRGVEAAYARVGVIEPKDKFAWMESIFQVKLDPQIDAYLYGDNTLQDWEDFIGYLKLQYGPTIRQQAQKLMQEVPRHDLKPSQYLTQLVEDTKDVSVDDIRKEHLLKTIPARYREIMGKEVEAMTAKWPMISSTVREDHWKSPQHRLTVSQQQLPHPFRHLCASCILHLSFQ